MSGRARAQVYRCDWRKVAAATRRDGLEAHDALLLLGPPGVGKTPLAIGLGRAAIREGCSVLFIAAPALVADLMRAHADGRLTSLS